MPELQLQVIDEGVDHRLSVDQRVVDILWPDPIKLITRRAIIRLLKNAEIMHDMRPDRFHYVLRLRVQLVGRGQPTTLRNFLVWLYHDGRLTEPEPKLKRSLFD